MPHRYCAVAILVLACSGCGRADGGQSSAISAADSAAIANGGYMAGVAQRQDTAATRAFNDSLAAQRARVPR